MSRGNNSNIRVVFTHPTLPSRPYIDTDIILPYTSPFNLIALAICQSKDNEDCNQYVDDSTPHSVHEPIDSVGVDEMDVESDEKVHIDDDNASNKEDMDVASPGVSKDDEKYACAFNYDVFKSNMSLMVKTQAAVESMKRRTIDQMSISDVLVLYLLIHSQIQVVHIYMFPLLIISINSVFFHECNC